MSRNSNRPSNEELRQLVKENPEYRSATLLGRYLVVNTGTARRYLRSAEIIPYDAGESKRVISRQSNISFRTEAVREYLIDNTSSKELARRYSRTPPSILSWVKDDVILQRISHEANISLEKLNEMRNKRLDGRGRTTRKFNFNSRLAILGDYIFGGKKLDDINSSFSNFTIYRWVNDESLLQNVADVHGIDLSELGKLIYRKIKRIPLPVKIDAVKRYLFTEASSVQIAHLYGITIQNFRSWYENRRVIENVSKKTGENVDVLKERAKTKIQRKLNLMSQEEIIDFYQQNYEGLNSSQLIKYNNDLYNELTIRRLAKTTFGLRSFRHMTDKEMKQFYIDNYRGLTRIELQNADESFYTMLSKRKLLDIVPSAKVQNLKRLEFLETNEEAHQMFELAGEVYAMLDTEEERNAVISNTEQAVRRRFGRNGYSQEEARLHIGRKLNGGVVIKPSYNGKNPVDMLTQAEKIGIIGSETIGRMVGRIIAEGMQSRIRTPDEMIEELYQMKDLA